MPDNNRHSGTMNAREIVLDALREWGYAVRDAQGTAIILQNDTIIEILPMTRSVHVDVTVHEDDQEDYFYLLEAANLMNESHFLHTHFNASETYMDVLATVCFNYWAGNDLLYKLRRAIMTAERLQEAFKIALSLAKQADESDDVDIKPLLDAVDLINEDIAKSMLVGKTILYIHGFASSGNSGTAAEIQRLLPESRVLSPDLPIDPFAAYDMLRGLIDKESVDIVVGTSMGGMFANLLDGVPKILVNPSFHVSESMRKKIGVVPFFKKRADGATEFEVTESLCDSYQRLERQQLASFSERDTGETFALFGTEDNVINCQDEYIRFFGDAYENITCGHRLTNDAIRRSLIPAMAELAARNT